MSDNISRQATLEAIQKHFNPTGEEMPTEVAAVLVGVGVVISTQPSTDRTGHWVGVCEYCHHLTEVTGELYLPSGFRNHNICDQCWQSAPEKSDYCPNCGADMRGEQDDQR